VSATKTRYVAKVEDTFRTVFAVAEQPNSFDLTLYVTSGGREYSASSLYDLVAVSDEALFQECEKHITVHCSPRSGDVNVIKRTVELPGEVRSTVQVTTGMKQDNRFVPVLFRVCGDLSRDRYRVPKGCADELAPLATLSPNTDQLRFMVVVSRPGTHFPQDIEHPTNMTLKGFENFNLTILWSFLNRPSHAHAIDFFLQTEKETGPIRGFEWWEIYNLYTDLNMAHASQYFKAFPERGA
jgi:hypothetical protein